MVTVDGEEVVAGFDGAFDGGGAEGDDFADDETLPELIGFAIEAEAEIADRGGLGAGGGADGAVDAGVGGVELADEEVDVAAEFVGRCGRRRCRAARLSWS